MSGLAEVLAGHEPHSGEAGMSEHEEDVNDGSMCVCGQVLAFCEEAWND